MKKINKKLILILLIIIVLFFIPFRELKARILLNKQPQELQQVISLVETNSLEIDERKNALLPKSFSKSLNMKEIVVYKNEENKTVIGFWIFRGMMSSSNLLIYSSSSKKLIKESLTTKIISIKELKEHWYYVTIDGQLQK